MSEQESVGCDQDFLEVKKFYSGEKEDKYFVTKTQLRKKIQPCQKWPSDTKIKEQSKLWM